MEKNKSRFSLFANAVSAGSGSWSTFAGALTSIFVWIIIGALFQYSGAWKEWAALYMSAVTFLLVFLIQHAQNRATTALHLKLDELIRATQGAHTSLLKVEELSDEDLGHLSDEYKGLADSARENVTAGQSDVHIPDMDLLKKKKDGK